MEPGKMRILNMSSNKPGFSNQIFIIVLLAFLGLSPIGDPHLVGKLNWILGGAVGMKPMDWFDFVMHGGSLLISILLTIRIILALVLKAKK